MLSGDLGEKNVFSKVPKFLHMVFNVIEEYCVFLSLVFASVLSCNICKNLGFS